MSQICSVLVKWLAVWVLTSTLGTNSLQIEHFSRTIIVFSLSWVSVILPLQSENISQNVKIQNCQHLVLLLSVQSALTQLSSLNNNTWFVMFLYIWFLTSSSSSWVRNQRNLISIYIFYLSVFAKGRHNWTIYNVELLSFSTEYTAHKICLGLEDDNSSLSHSTCRQDDAKGRAGRERF